MARTANPENEGREVQVATKLSDEEATTARLAAMVDPEAKGNLGNYIRNLILAATSDFSVEVKRGGKVVPIRKAG